MIASGVRDVSSLEEMRRLAEEIAASLGPRLVLLLEGPMGAGKTQLTRFLVEALGGNETVSPSFAIHNSYPTAKKTVEHFDLFRLESEDDLESTGFWEVFRAKDALVVIEWVSRLDEMGLRDGLPISWPRLTLEIEPSTDGPDSRRVRIRAG